MLVYGNCHILLIKIAVFLIEALSFKFSCDFSFDVILYPYLNLDGSLFVSLPFLDLYLERVRLMPVDDVPTTARTGLASLKQLVISNDVGPVRALHQNIVVLVVHIEFILIIEFIPLFTYVDFV